MSEALVQHHVEKAPTDGEPTSRAALQFKHQLANMGYEEQLKAVAPPQPVQSVADAGPSDAPVQMAGGGTTLDLRTECDKNPVAKQKWADVQAETAPRAVALRPDFIRGATNRLNGSDRGDALNAMRNEIAQSGQKYLCLGPAVPAAQILSRGGVSRVVDLPGLYNHGYLKPTVRARYRDANHFVSEASNRRASPRFDPNNDLDNRKNLRGRAAETWWFPSNLASNRMNLTQLRNALYIQDDPNYAKGAVKLDMTPADLQSAGIEVFKPTAYDGAMQGWGTDPWWVPSSDPHWGVTKNNTPEAVMRAQRLRFYKRRTLMLP